MAANPVALQIPAGSQGTINCLANATFFQRVTLTWSGQAVVFSGTGEGKAMTLPNGDSMYTLPPSVTALTIAATFEYSSVGASGPFQKATVRDPVVEDKGGFHVIQVTSEDSTDNDWNDSYLTIATVAR
jgi:hypothetical protein